MILVAVGAGLEAEEEAQRRWSEEKPDEYFFLEMFGSAVVEHLTTAAGARLCDWAEQRGMAVLPHYSPGYPEWDVAEQPRLLDLMKRTRSEHFPSRVDVFESGMLRPKKTLLAVFGLTRHTERLQRLTSLVPCESCSFGPCQYRRAPYKRAPRSTAEPVHATDRRAGRRRGVHRESTSPRALDERAACDAPCADGSLEIDFRYDGTTCTNMGRPLTFIYNVKLGPRAEGYPIREQRCAPAAGDTGHTSMCKYIEDADSLMSAIEIEKPLNGERLNAVLGWRREPNAAGCYCEPSSREHKWGLVLETIHYALVQKELEQENEGHEEAFARSDSGAAAAVRRRHGHAADARRAGTGQLRRGVEPDASGARARHPAALCRGRLRLHHHQHLWRIAHHAQPPRRSGAVAAINKAGVEIARQAFGDREGYVLGDIGPFGGLLEPFGEFTEAQVRSAFEEQAAALVEGGADAIIIETQTSLEELLIGIEAAQTAARQVHHRVDGLRCDARRLDLPHHDGR